MKTFSPFDTMTLHCDSGSRHDFPRLARESGFSFNLYRGRVDWAKIGSIDVDKIVRERDLETLQDVLSSVMSCSLNSEYDLKVLDPNFIKIFQLAQLGADFLLYCRNYLDHCVTVMQEQLRVALQEIEQLHKLKQTNSQEINNLQKKLKAKLKSTRSNNNSPHPIFKCSGCEKVFGGEQYLLAHQQRRHPELSSSEPMYSNQSREVDSLQQQVHDLQNRLQATEEALKQKQDSYIPDAAVLQAMLKSELQKIKPISFQSPVVEAHTTISSPPQHIQSASGDKNLLDVPVEPQAADQTQPLGSDLQSLSCSSEQEKLKYESTLSVKIEQQNNEIETLKDQLKQQNQAHELVMQRKLKEIQRQHRADLDDLRLSIIKSRGSGDHIVAPSSAGNGASFVDSPQSAQHLLAQGAIQAWDKTVKGSEEGISTLLVNKDTIVEPPKGPMSIKSREENVIQEDYVSPADPESSDSSSPTSSPDLASPVRDNVRIKQGEKTLFTASSSSIKNQETPEHSKSMYGRPFCTEVKNKDGEKSVTVASSNSLGKPVMPDHSKSMQAKSSSSNSATASETGSSSYDSDSQSPNSEQESSPKESESRAIHLTPQVLDGLKEDLLGLLNRRLRELGVDPEWKELPVASFNSNIDTVKHHQNIAAKSQKNYFGIQEALVKEVDKRVSEHLKLQQSTPNSSKTREKRSSGSFSIFARIKSHVKSKLSPSGHSSRISKYPQKSSIKLKTGDLVENVYSEGPSTSNLKSSHEFEVLQKKPILANVFEPVSKGSDVESIITTSPITSAKPTCLPVNTTDVVCEDSREKMKLTSSGISTNNTKIYTRSMYPNLNKSDIEVEKKDSSSDSSTKQPVQLKTSTPIKSSFEASSKSGTGKPTFISSDIESISEVESDLNDIMQNTSEKSTAISRKPPHTTLTTAELLANVAKFCQNSGQFNSTQSIVKSNLKSSLSTGNIMKKKVMFRDEKDGFNTIELGPAQASFELLTSHRSHSENSLSMAHSSPLNSDRPVPQPRSSLLPTTVTAASTSAANTDSDEDWDWDKDSSDTLTLKRTEGEKSGGFSFSDTKGSGQSNILINEQHGGGGSRDRSSVSDLVRNIERQNPKDKPSFGISITGPKSSELATARPFSYLGNITTEKPSVSGASSLSFGSLQGDKLSDLLLDDISSC